MRRSGRSSSHGTDTQISAQRRYTSARIQPDMPTFPRVADQPLEDVSSLLLACLQRFPASRTRQKLQGRHAGEICRDCAGGWCSS